MLRSTINTVNVISVIILTITLFWGCSTTEIQTALPTNHPASPAAAEAAFEMPPDPFAEKSVLIETEGSHGHTVHGVNQGSNMTHYPSKDDMEMPHGSHAKPLKGDTEMEHQH